MKKLMVAASVLVVLGTNVVDAVAMKKCGMVGGGTYSVPDGADCDLPYIDPAEKKHSIVPEATTYSRWSTSGYPQSWRKGKEYSSLAACEYAKDRYHTQTLEGAIALQKLGTPDRRNGLIAAAKLIEVCTDGATPAPLPPPTTLAPAGTSNFAPAGSSR